MRKAEGKKVAEKSKKICDNKSENNMCILILLVNTQFDWFI